MTLILVGQLEEREIRFPLLPGTHAVGRGRDCALQLLDPSVSRRHAEIEVGPGLLLVRDLDSQNGTSVNGERIAAPTALAAGARVAFAGIVLRVEEESLPLGTLTRLSESGRVESYDEVSWEEVRGARAEGEDKRARLFRVMAEAGELLAVRRAPEELFQAALDLVESALAPERIVVVETGGCPHTAIREDASMNLEAIARLQSATPGLDLIFVESGGDNLAATFSPELSDLTLYVIDVAGGEKIPRKGGPGITKSDLLVINKTDLAPLVGASLEVMERDTRRMRGSRPWVFTNLKTGEGLAEVIAFLEREGMLGLG